MSELGRQGLVALEHVPERGAQSGVAEAIFEVAAVLDGDDAALPQGKDEIAEIECACACGRNPRINFVQSGRATMGSIRPH